MRATARRSMLFWSLEFSLAASLRFPADASPAVALVTFIGEVLRPTAP